MKFIHRIGYYLGGFSIGLIILAFFLSGKKTSCAYGPNARTIKNISQKQKIYSDDAILTMQSFEIDTTIVSDLIKYGDVNFSESDTKAEDCKTYIIKNNYKNQNFRLQIKNCDSSATIESINAY
ncbi:MAG TPA: hypothetical protein VNJ50_04015 [Gelidibacter sp.]|uniref:hypothetical protein n=1 Tax=Gelidibacter sp. TaxID=2018083 RepID=UPI002BF4F6E6|nr:hypothetical protein [Gelidibacter sp.]HXJ97987.1 hypothetical protein [Gelidibacter sp.]